MGDTGKGLYVKPDIPEIFKKDLLPMADIVTPNQFELEILTGLETGSLEGARRAAARLHEQGPGVVLITSFRIGNGREEGISMLASDRTGLYQISTPELPLGPGLAGSGDLTAAVFLSRYLETGNVKRTLELCTASVYGILAATYRERPAEPGPAKEILLIGAQRELTDPSSSFEAKKV
jgi:pyridoxine kinase